jgi:creatinine amidohydrolase
LHYAELHPQDLANAFSQQSPAVVPIGALEWHGSHLPLGTDLLVAEAFATRLAKLLGGILLPAYVTPTSTLPHPFSLQLGTEGYRTAMDDTLGTLARAGAKTIAVVTGHYSPGHEVELYEAAMRVMDDNPGVKVFAAAPLEPVGDASLLDHAGRVETSLMMAIRPDLVRLEALNEHEPAVLGEDPRRATPEAGESLLTQGLAAWRLWMESDSRALEQWYGKRFDAYQSYVDVFYKGPR